MMTRCSCLLVVVLAACSGESGQTCFIGAEGCGCTSGGSCDAPLVCLDGICVPLSDADTDAPEDSTTDAPEDPHNEGECSADEDCDDLDPCTIDACDTDGGECTHAPADLDADGFPAMQVDGVECTGGTDCDDDRDDVYPGAAPDCTGEVDRNCSGLDDRDEDGDGYVTDACSGDDCDDAEADTFPGSLELACDEDRDCNGRIDADNDGDEYDRDECGGDDCDDGNPAVNPGASELECSGLDDDCNGEMSTYEDADQDGYARLGCAISEAEVDCDEGDPTVHPGAPTTCDTVDDDCSGSWQDESGSDDDGDGSLDATCGGDDCDDTDPEAYPGAPDLCPDAIDQDCDGVVGCHVYETCNTSGICEITFVTVPAGTFTMGSPLDEPGRFDDEVQHEVTLTRSFEIQAVEVTREQFEAVMGYDPSSFPTCGIDCPVGEVDWYMAAAYANAVSTLAGLPECYNCAGSGTTRSCVLSAPYATPYDCPGYRLPTEAEWEYAARAGTTGGTYNGTSTVTDCTTPDAVLDPVAWYCGNSSDTTHPVGLKAPNALGLYDMLGNAREWCHDWYAEYVGDETDPWGPATGPPPWANRGGDYESMAMGLRSAYRLAQYSGFVLEGNGLRLVRTLP